MEGWVDHSDELKLLTVVEPLLAEKPAFLYGSSSHLRIKHPYLFSTELFDGKGKVMLSCHTFPFGEGVTCK